MAPVGGTCEKPHITPEISNIDIQETDRIHFSGESHYTEVGESHYTEVEKGLVGYAAIPSDGIF
jgi:hypothetical protein